MTYFVFSDIHSCLNELKAALNQAGYNEIDNNHKLLFLGDAFDKEHQHFETYLFLKNNIENNKLIWVIGNHDLFLLHSLAINKASRFTEDTIRDIAKGLDDKAINYSDSECIKVLKDNGVDKFIINNTLNYYETNNYVFTHGVIPFNTNNTYDPNWRNRPNKDWYRYINTGFKKLLDNNIRIPNKTLVCGHQYCGIKKDAKPLITDRLIAIDGNCYKTGIMNVIVIKD
jgi:serine/threonine protein phosphatase 1